MLVENNEHNRQGGFESCFDIHLGFPILAFLWLPDHGN